MWYQPTLKITSLSFLPSHPPPTPIIWNLQTVLPPIFKQSSLYVGFSWTLPKCGIFLWTPKISNFFLLKGNPNIQSILNWIIQILHYNCRNQHKNIKNSRIIEENVAISLSALLSAYCDLRFFRLPQRQGVFSPWKQFWASQVIIRAVYSFIFCFENDFL